MQQQQLIYINSINKYTGDTNSNFKATIKIASDEYDHACVLGASIPISYYMVQSGYNTFNLIEQTTTKTISVDIGNYNISNFSTKLKALLNANTSYAYVYDVSYSIVLGKIIISVSNNAGVQPVIQMINTNLYKFFGFNAGSSNTFVSNTLTSTNVCQFITEETLYIHSDLVQNNDDNVLQDVYASSFIPFSTITYQATAPIEYAKKINTNKNNIYNFYLLNENDEPINLNGCNMSLTILLFKKNDETLLKEYIKYQLSK